MTTAGSTAGGTAGAGVLLHLDRVTKAYGAGVVALDDVSLTVHEGELVAVVGPSGSGKSTLLNIIGTLDRPTRGTISLQGRAVVGLPDRELSALRATSLGFVFQNFHLSPELTAAENVATGLLYAGVPRRHRRDLAVQALHRVGLGNRVGHRPHQLSGGEQQRVAIARAVANRPALVLADEPTGALDTATSGAVIELMRQLNAEGTTIMVITHDPEIAGGMPRRVELRDGRLVTDTGAEDAAAPTPQVTA